MGDGYVFEISYNANIMRFMHCKALLNFAIVFLEYFGFNFA